MAMRPLEKLPTIRAKLGSVIVFAVAVTLLVRFVLIAFYLRNSPRDTEEIAALGLAGQGPLRGVGPLPADTMGVTPGADGDGTGAGGGARPPDPTMDGC